MHHVKLPDVSRVCRSLAGSSLAVVLGGHAEGVSCFVYLGILTAFQHHDIPIDILGGSFSGAMVSALFALGMTPV